MYSLEQIRAAIKRADAAGDVEASNRLARAASQLAGQLSPKEAAPDPLEGMSTFDRVRANVGAGMMDYALGAKQLFGMADGSDAREKAALDEKLANSVTGGRALQFAGQVAPAAVTAFAAPGLLPQVLAGGAAGAFMPTENDSVGLGKAVNVGMGALGGAAGVGLGKALPWVAKKGGDALRHMRPNQTAERAFLNDAGDPAAAAKAISRYRDVPNTEPTTAQILRNPTMLSVERKVSETGGEGATQLAAARAKSNAARYQFLSDEFKDNPEKLWEVASDFAEANKPRSFSQPFKAQPVVGELGRLRNSTTNPRARAMFGELQQRVKEAAASGDPLGQLHEIRMTGIDDALSTLSKSDKNLAGMLSRNLQGVKSVLDREMDRATSGQWKPFLEGYSRLARKAEIAENGAALMGRVNKAAPDMGGVPSVSATRQSVLRGAADQTDRFGNPIYSDTGQDTIRAVLSSLDTEAAPLTVRPAGSATAANIASASPAQETMRLLAPKMGQMPQSQASRWAGNAAGMATGGLLGTMAGGPAAGALGGLLGGAIGEGVQALASRQAGQIAERLFTLYTNPGEALKVLQAAVKAGQMPAGLAMQVQQILQSRAARTVGQGLLGSTGYAAAAIPSALTTQ